MATTNRTAGDYDTYAAEYAAYVARREQGREEGDPLGILPCLLELLGDVADYFDSDAISPYLGLFAAGIKTYQHHRTLEEYLGAFLVTGLRLAKLADLTGRAHVHEPGTILPEGTRFPRFLLLAFVKP